MPRKGGAAQARCEQLWQQASAPAKLPIRMQSTTLCPPARPLHATRELKELTISAGLISQADGQILKDLLKNGLTVSVALNWTDLLPKADKVEWEWWTNSNDECGLVCDQQRRFIKEFKASGKLLQIKVRGWAAWRLLRAAQFATWVCQRHQKYPPQQTTNTSTRPPLNSQPQRAWWTSSPTT